MGKTVCVTGASGFIASWLVKLLLERGYTVRATVRNLSDPSKFKHLKALEGAKERLQLFQADLIVEGSFDAVVDGCDGVFHTASPVILDNVNDPQRELIEPAVKGTLNVLNSCLKASVKRVVLTSSMSAIFVQRNIKTTDVLDETWFSDPNLCEEIKEWYALSKTLAEQAARKFAQENGIELLAMNPGLVSGPILQPTLNRTSESFASFVREGKNDVMPGGIFLYVDVRDVAHAHILAFENPSANGRYCLVAKVLHGSEAFRILCDLYPTLNLPKSSGEDQPATLPYQVSNEKAKSLGINFISLEQSLKDTVESLKERNLISFTV